MRELLGARGAEGRLLEAERRADAPVHGVGLGAGAVRRDDDVVVAPEVVDVAVRCPQRRRWGVIVGRLDVSEVCLDQSLAVGRAALLCSHHSIDLVGRTEDDDPVAAGVHEDVAAGRRLRVGRPGEAEERDRDEHGDTEGGEAGSEGSGAHGGSPW